MTTAAVYDWLLLLHVLGAMLWLGGLAALAVFGGLVVRSGDSATVARFVRSLRVVGPVLLAPAASAVLAFGAWMVADSPAWTVSQTWIRLALGLLAAAVLVGVVFLSRVGRAAERAVDAGDDAQALRHLARWSWGIRLILLLLVVASWDMVFKPGL